MTASSPTRHRWVAMIAVTAALVAAGCTAAPAKTDPSKAPKGPLAQVCENPKPGPAAAPPGAVTIDPSVPADAVRKTDKQPAGTTFWFAPGTHRLGDHRYSQITPKPGNTYLGAPGAVLDGREVVNYAFVGTASDVTIRHLTVQGFVPPTDQGVVNHDSGDHWVIEHNTVQRNRGAALMAGARQRVVGNCLRDNGQYGMNAFKDGNTITGLLVVGNEIAGNNKDDIEASRPGCGCTGGVKFWSVDGADVRGNWIHDNHGPGLWADTNNNDFLIERNLIEGNDGSAVLYEASYNAVIRDNTIRRNNWVNGREYADRGDNFPVATIYLSEAGGEPEVPARTDKIEVYRNRLQDNWSGITLWENADRFCNSAANTSSGSCTLLVDGPEKCSAPAIKREPLYSDCRWKTQRVEIHHNRFSIDPAVVKCKSLCARMAVLSNFGTYPKWSPYHGAVVQQAITFDQQNEWHDNTYLGPWTFMPHDTGQLIYPARWQVGPYLQDRGSTFLAVRSGQVG